jgi:predicted O-linked N-acetylglucosamine transferase (SPINDLY family)
MGQNVSTSANAKLDRGFDLYEAGDLDGATAVCEEILRADERHYGALYLLGSVLGEQKQLDEAAATLKRAIAVDPSRPVAHFNLATVLWWKGLYGEALAAIDAYLALKPESAEAFALRVDACSRLGRLDEALASAQRAIVAAPEDPEAHDIHGKALAKLERYDEARASYDRAVALDSRFAKAYRDRALVWRRLGRDDRALEDFAKAMELAPGLDFLASEMCYLRQQLCDWPGLAPQMARIREAVAAGERVENPFVVSTISNSGALNRKAAEMFVANEARRSPPPLAATRLASGGKIRLGYFSADFNDHPVARLMAGVFERHDRRRFEVSAFSFGRRADDDMRRRLIAAFDRFVDVRDRSDQQAAELAQSLGVDIAIDLNGFTENQRIGVFARRAAPIQVNYLGYPGTTAAPFIDYVIADSVVAPEERRSDFSERVVRLPNCYLPYDPSSCRIADETPARASLSLPPDGFVFCCFNNAYKITLEGFDGWMRILQRTSGGVLWLRIESEAAAANLRREAQARGVDPDRLVFARRLPAEQHLARHRLAGVFLDTLPYNAHATACDALWTGLPVVTRIGETFPGRVAASALTAVGLPELITRSQAEYEALAVELAADPAKLAAIKAKLARNRLTSPLFDAERFTRDLEAAFEAMCERRRLDLPPEDIRLAR